MIIGRRTERHLLDAWAAEAFDGALRVVLVNGDGGMGKSALVDEAVAGWAAGTARVLSGHCQEDSSVPALPVLTSLGSLVDLPLVAPDDESLVARASGTSVVLTDALIAEAGRRPVVLRIDDVHWADRATVEFFSHLLQTVAHRSLVERLSLLVVLGTRPPAAGTAPHRFLERLARDGSTRRLQLGALSELEINGLLQYLVGRPPSRRLLRDVVDVTEGNPLFVHTLVEHLRARGALVEDRGEVVATEQVMAEYTRLDAMAADRLAPLSVTAVELLSTAALLGDGEPVELLAGIHRLDEAELDAVLAELERLDVLVERADGRYWFTRTAVRQHLVRSLTPRERRSRHHDIARYLATCPESGPTWPLKVAHHFGRAGSRVDPESKLIWARRAVDRSLELGAWSRAARHAEAALQAIDELGPDHGTARMRRDLYLAAGLAHFRDHDGPAAERACRRVIDLARPVQDLDAWGRALLILHRSLLTLGSATVDAGTHDALHGFLDAAGDAVPEIRARCWELVAEIAVSAGDLDFADEAAGHAVELATTLADDVLVAETRFAQGLARFGALDLWDANEHFEASEEHARAGDDRWILAWPMVRRGMVQLLLGRLGEADRVLTAAWDLGQDTQHWAEAGLAEACSATVALTRLDTGAADRHAEDALRCHSRSSYPFIARVAWPVAVYLRALRQDRLGAIEELDRWRDAAVGGSERFRVLVDVLTLPNDEFVAGFDRERYRPTTRRSLHAYQAGMVEVDVEVGCRLGDRDLLGGALDVLGALEERGTELLLPVGSSVGRLRGMALHGVGEHDRALRELSAAGERLVAAGARREALRCELERWIVLADTGRSETAELAASVADTLDEASLLGLYQRLREHLPLALLDGFRLHRTVVCWDIVDSTRRLVAVGDAAFVSVLHDLDGLLRRRLVQHRGQAFKQTGDGIVAWFHEEADALRCVRDVARDLVVWERRDPETSVRLRAGLAAGEPVDDAGDLFGVAVVTAIRLCDAARDGQLALCTAEVADVGAGAVTVRPHGDLDLKGLAGPVSVMEVVDESV